MEPTRQARSAGSTGRPRQHGQSVVEYALFIGLIALVTVGIIGGIGSQTSTVFVDINQGLEQPTGGAPSSPGSGSPGSGSPPAPSATPHLSSPPTVAPPTVVGGGSFPGPTTAPTNTPASPGGTPVPPTATRTNTPVPPTATATRTNTPVPPTATATRTNTPVPPTATATNTPVPMCRVPSFSGVRAKYATSSWTSAGFTGSINFVDGLYSSSNSRIYTQSLSANSWQPCSSGITLGKW